MNSKKDQPLGREKVAEILLHYNVNLLKYKVVVVAVTDYFMDNKDILKDSIFVITPNVFAHFNACVNQQHGRATAPRIVDGAYYSFSFGERKTTFGKNMSHMKYVETMLQDIDTIDMHLPGYEGLKLGRDYRNKKYKDSMGIHRGNGIFTSWFRYCFFQAYVKVNAQPNGFTGIHHFQFKAWQELMKCELHREHGKFYEKHVVPFVVISYNTLKTWNGYENSK